MTSSPPPAAAPAPAPAARGSGRRIGGLALGFVLAVLAMRGGSDFLAVEAEAPRLHALARAHELPSAAVFALREQSAALSVPAFDARLAAFRRLQVDLGEPLAAVAVLVGEEQARSLRAAAATAAAAWEAVAHTGDAVAGARYLAMRDRFARRAAVRNGN